jgi:hypothetical protein
MEKIENIEKYPENFKGEKMSNSNQQLMPVFSLGGVSATTPTASSSLIETNKTSKLKKSSNNDSAVSLSPLSSSPLPSLQQQQQKQQHQIDAAAFNSTLKLKTLIKRNQAAAVLSDKLNNSAVDLHCKSPDQSGLNRIVSRSNIIVSPRFSITSNSSVKTTSPTQNVNLINSTIYEFQEKKSFDSSQLILKTTTANNNNNNNTGTKSQNTTPTTPNRLFPDLNGFKLNPDIVTSTSLLAITNNKINGVGQIKRRILSTVDIKLKEENDNRLRELDFLSTIGTGTFGRVMCVRQKATKKYFALKIMSIINIIKLKQVDHVKNEKNILESINHPFIVKLFWTHHTDQFLCKYCFVNNF